jgi:tRNA threonylcarbamoyladenosine biosynthesis protein TsaE
VGELLGSELRPDGVLLLHGDLGSGKTVLTRGVARALGIDPAEVQSPTFVLVREHEGPEGRLLHADLYRLEPSEAEAAGIEELLAGPGVKVVEWAERLAFAPHGALRLSIDREGPGDARLVRELTDPSR